MKGYIFVFLAIISTVYAADECEKLPDHSFRAHESDCTKFYVCNFKKSVLKTCSFELHFNRIKKYCQSKASAGCDLTQTTIEPETTTETPTVSTKPTTPTTPTKPTTPTITPKPPSNICKGQPLGQNIPFVGDCTKYITCIGGPVVRDCPESTHFNKLIQVCDWPERANCPWW